MSIAAGTADDLLGEDHLLDAARDLGSREERFAREVAKIAAEHIPPPGPTATPTERRTWRPHAGALRDAILNGWTDPHREAFLEAFDAVTDGALRRRGLLTSSTSATNVDRRTSTDDFEALVMRSLEA